VWGLGGLRERRVEGLLTFVEDVRVHGLGFRQDPQAFGFGVRGSVPPRTFLAVMIHPESLPTSSKVVPRLVVRAAGTGHSN